MNEREKQIEILDRWLLNVSEGTSTAEDTHRVNELLASDADLREYVVKRLIDDSLLAEQLRESAAESILRGHSTLPSEATDLRGPRSRLRTHTWTLGILAVAICLLIAVALPWMLPDAGTPDSPSPSDIANIEDPDGDFSPLPMLDGDAVAILTRAVDVQWAEGQSPLSVDASLRPNTIRLDKGLIQLEFFSGATVVVEGPAEFSVESAMRCKLAFGKVRADVPMQARGFTIANNSLDAVDLGTEFAMHVEKNGEGEVHVLSGDVSLQTRDGLEKQLLRVGDAVRHDADGVLANLGAVSDLFVGIEKLKELDQEQQDDRFKRWQKQSEKWANDPNVLLYYDFQQANQDTRRLRSAIEDASVANDGAVIGCQWREGRFAGKHGLEFKRVSDRVRVHVPGEFESLSMVVWLRVEGIERWYNSLFLTDSWNPGEPHWQITNQGKIVFGVKGSGDYATRPALDPSHLGRWVQIASVYNGDSGVVDFYLNGKRIKRWKTRGNTPLRIGDAEIGNWSTTKSGDRNIRSLNGVIDEIAIFSRPLTKKEIETAYQTGNPYQ